MKRTSLIGPLTLALALLLSAGALTADENSPEEEGTSPETSFFAVTTVTATGREADAFEISTPVSVISAEEIERKAPENAAQLLLDQPGVDLNGVGPNQARPVIRGVRGLRVLFLENGLRLNNPRRQTDFGEISGLVDLANVEAVEVVRGPASVLYGTDAIGGVLNLVTRVAGPASGVKGSLGLRYGSAGDQVGGRATVEKRGEQWSFLVGGSIRESSSYDAASGSFGEIRLDDEVEVLDSGVDELSLWSHVGFAFDDRHALSLRLSRYSADDAGFGLVDPALIGDYSGALVRILYPFQDVDRVTVGYEGFDLGGPVADSVDVRLYHQSNERELVNDIDINIGPLFPGAPDSAVEADTLNFTDIDTLGMRAEMRKILGDDNLLTWGVEFYEDDSFNTDSSVTTTRLRFPFPPFEEVFESTDTVANAPNATNRSWSVFLQDEFQAGDRLSLTAGLRYQNVETRAEPTPGWDITGLDFDDDNVVGSLSAVYQLSDNLNLVGSVGTAFRAPNIVERLFNGLTPEGIGFQLLNPDLVSEESENVDLGLKYRRANVIFELTAFRNEISDGIVQASLTAEEIAQLPQEIQDQIDVSGVDVVVQQRNASSLTYEGVEAIVGYRFESGLSLGGNLTFLDAESDDALTTTGDVYEDKIVAFARWEPVGKRFWVEYRLRHNGSADVDLGSGEAPPVVGSELPSFTVHTLSGGYDLFERGSQRHRVGLVIENLTDELYAEFSNATFFRPQAGRSAVLTYRVGL